MNLAYLVSAGFSKAEVYEMTIRQVLLLAQVSVKLKKLERLSSIADMQIATPGIDEQAYYKHVNSLKYD